MVYTLFARIQKFNSEEVDIHRVMTDHDVTNSGQQSGSSNVPINRRRILQLSAVAMGSTVAGQAGASGAAGECESVLPDVIVFNADDRVREVTLGVDGGPGTAATVQSTLRVEPGEFREIESVASSVEGRRLTAAADGSSTLQQELSELAPERFRKGMKVTIGPEETGVEALHVDLPPQRYADLLRRCADE